MYYMVFRNDPATEQDKPDQNKNKYNFIVLCLTISHFVFSRNNFYLKDGFTNYIEILHDS